MGQSTRTDEETSMGFDWIMMAAASVAVLATIQLTHVLTDAIVRAVTWPARPVPSLCVSLPSFPSAGNVFGDQKTMKERIREQKRMVERSVRGLERDRANLERDEKKLILEIKVR